MEESYTFSQQFILFLHNPILLSCIFSWLGAQFLKAAIKLIYGRIHSFAELHDNSNLESFRELGYGTIDFKAVKAALEEIGYNGILCVELDTPTIGNYHAAETSRKYIKDVLNI